MLCSMALSLSLSLSVSTEKAFAVTGIEPRVAPIKASKQSLRPLDYWATPLQVTLTGLYTQGLYFKHFLFQECVDLNVCRSSKIASERYPVWEPLSFFLHALKRSNLPYVSYPLTMWEFLQDHHRPDQPAEPIWKCHLSENDQSELF